jgi:pentatricopeptide repeat protein
MNDIGMAPSKEIYDIIIDGFGKCGNFYAMKKVLSMMQERNLAPNLDTWNIILKNYGLCKETDEMIKTFNDIKLSFTPSTFTSYNFIHVQIYKLTIT